MTETTYRWAAVGVLSLVGLVIGLDTTVLNVALPTLAVELGATTSQLQWFADAYLLALAALLLPAALLGDRSGRKATTVVALVVFGAGSVWCAYAPSAGHLIAARSLMGVGAAVATPLALSWLVVLFDEQERPKAMGVLGAASFIGLPLGPVVAGWLLQHYRWGSVFLINVPLLGLALLGAVLSLPAHTSRSGRRVDGLGIVLSVTGLAALTYGLIEAPVRGWGDPLILACCLAGLGVLVVFAVWEVRRGPDGLMIMSLWREPAFAWGTGVLSVATMLGMVVLFSVPIYLQGVLGLDAIGAGVRLLPLIGGIVLGVAVSLVVSRRAGYRASLLVGLAALAAGAAVGSRTAVASDYGWVAAWLTTLGLGFGTLAISCQNLALSRLDHDSAGAGAATVQVARQTGSVLGIAVLVSVLNTVYRGDVVTAGLPAPLASAVRDSVHGGLAVAERLGSDELALAVKTAFLHGMATQLWLGVGLAGALVLAVIIGMPRGLGVAGGEPPAPGATPRVDEHVRP